MNDPQQIRRALTDIRSALDTFPREALAEVLALVFKEYVVEGHQPLASGGHVLDAKSDLEGMSFPELIVWLQTHLDHPELALFEVSGADVSVRSEGRSTRLQARPAPPPQALAAPPAPIAQPGMVTSSVRTQAAPPRATPALATPSTPPVASAAPTGAVAPAKDEPSASETGTRFSLLEVD